MMVRAETDTILLNENSTSLVFCVRAVQGSKCRLSDYPKHTEGGFERGPDIARLETFERPLRKPGSRFTGAGRDAFAARPQNT